MSETSLKKEVDVLILGAGVAGAVAASALRKKKMSVAIIDKIGGATGQSSGAVDVAHSISHSNESIGYVEAAKYIAKTEFNHPYANCGQGLEHVEKALQELTELTGDVDLVGREDKRNMLLATQVGTLKYTAAVQRTQGFDLNDLSDGDLVGVVGFSGLPSFDARAVARMLAWSAENFAQKKIVVEPIQIDLRPEGRLWRSALEMALALDQPLMWEACEAKLRELQHQESGGYSAFLLPPILGRAHFKHAWQTLNDGAGERFFELLAMPHSVPALRLNDALVHGLSKLEVDRIEGEATSFKRDDSRITRVTVQVQDRQIEISARCVILATGRFFSGGFDRQGTKKEKLFGLPIWNETNELFSAGLKVDEKMRPYDRVMELFALNLFAAGSSLGGYDAGGSKSGMGLAALTGYLAALHTIEAMHA